MAARVAHDRLDRSSAVRSAIALRSSWAAEDSSVRRSSSFHAALAHSMSRWVADLFISSIAFLSSLCLRGAAQVQKVPFAVSHSKWERMGLGVSARS